MPLVLGFDCGGSSTKALVLQTETGLAIQEGKAAAANWAQTPRDSLRDNLLASTAGFPPVEAVAGCFAGLLTQDDKKEAEALLAELYPGAQVEAHADYAAALSAAPAGTTALIIAGTGSLVCSWGRDGAIQKSSGGGPLLTGDPGSVYTICRKALSRLLENPRSPEYSYLWPTVEAAFGATDPDQITAAFYSDPQRASRTCTLISAIVEQEIGPSLQGRQTHLANEMSSLILFLMGHLERFGHTGRRATIALTGGLWSVHPGLKRLFDRQIVSLMELVRGAGSQEPEIGQAVRSKVRDRIAAAVNRAVDDMREEPDPQLYEAALALAGTLRFWIQAFERADALDEFEVKLSPKYQQFDEFDTLLLQDSPAMGAARLAAKLLP